MTKLDPAAAENVHYATDPRIRHLAEAAWRMRTGGSRMDWLCLGKDNPEALIAEAREWVRAAVAAGIIPPPSSDPAWKAAAWGAANADEESAAEARETETRRRLTQREYSAAWHAVEGAAGEEGADPGTVLHAVLDRLGIDLPPAPPVHACPPDGSGLTPCCGRTPFELPRTDRMTVHLDRVTCGGEQP